MRNLNLALALLITLFAAIRAGITSASIASVDSKSLMYQQHTDPESLLARAEKLPFSCLNLAELELIPGISDTLGNAMLRSRNKVLKAWQQTRSYSALTLIEGVGDKRAQTLSAFLDLNQYECPIQRERMH